MERRPSAEDQRINKALLTTCKGKFHNFKQVAEHVSGYGAKCTFCGGIISSTAAHWYYRGIGSGLQMALRVTKDIEEDIYYMRHVGRQDDAP
jgi:hypothetical protein